MMLWLDRQETFVVSRDAPVYHKDLVLRRGTVWNFQLVWDSQLTAEADRLTSLQPSLRAFDRRLIGPNHDVVVWGKAPGNTFPDIFPSEVDERRGRASLTLPIEGRRVTISAALGSKVKSFQRSGLHGKAVLLSLEWATGFRPDSLKRIERKSQGYHLIDDAGRTADLECEASVEPTAKDGKLTITMKLPEPDRPQIKGLSGRVLDGEGDPVVGADVELGYRVECKDSDNVMHLNGTIYSGVRYVTDQNGCYEIVWPLFKDKNQKPHEISLMVKKEGFKSVLTPWFFFSPGADEPSQIVAPIRLEPGVSLSGTVVDPAGKPVVGAWVSGRHTGTVVMPTRTDDAGRFTLHDLPSGPVRVSCRYGELSASGTFAADGKGGEIQMHLQQTPDPAETPIKVTP